MPNKLDIKLDTGALKDTIINFIVPLICFGISVALIFLVIYPSIQQMPQLKSDLQTKTLLRTQLDTKVSTLNKLSDYKSVLEEDLQLLDRVLVSDDNVPYLLNQIDNITRGVGFALNKLNYGLGGSSDTEPGVTGAEYVAVNLGTTGSYEQLIHFLQNLEKAARLVNVSNFRYSLTTTEANDTLLSLSFLVYSPYLRVNSTATTDDPILLDIADPTFVSTINHLKSFTFYENTAPAETVKAEEKPIDEIEATEQPQEQSESETAEPAETTATPAL